MVSFTSQMYYLWYGTPAIDGRWMHWNHSVLPHWRADVQRKFPQGGMCPPASMCALL